MSKKGKVSEHTSSPANLNTLNSAIPPALKISLRQRMVKWYQGLRLMHKIIGVLIAIVGLLASSYRPIYDKIVGREIILGYANHSIDGNANSLQAKYQKQIADKATGKLKGSIKYRFRVSVPEGGYDQLMPAITNNTVDIAFLSSFQYLVEKLNNSQYPLGKAGIKVLAKEQDYYSIFLVHSSSPIRGLSDINPVNVNRILLGPDGNSTSTNVIPTIFLWKHGFTENMDQARSRLDIIKEVGSGKDNKLIGVIASPDWEDLLASEDYKAVDQGTMDNIRAIKLTDIPIPFDAVIINTSLNNKVDKEEDKQAIYQALGEYLDREIDWNQRNADFVDFILSGTITKKIDDKHYGVMLPPGNHDLKKIGEKIQDNDQNACLFVYLRISGRTGTNYPLIKMKVGIGKLRKKTRTFFNEAEFEMTNPLDKTYLDPEKFLLQVELCN